MKVKAVEDKVKVTEAEASRAIESYKNFEDFKSEVEEATYDAYLKGFIECEAKVFEAFFSLDLQDIVTKVKE